MRLTGPRVPNYDDSALCAQTDVSLFFPLKGESPRPAKAVCKLCPFLDECYEYAIHYDLYGIWGGTSHRERRKIRTARNIIPQPVVGYWDHHEPVAS